MANLIHIDDSYKNYLAYSSPVPPRPFLPKFTNFFFNKAHVPEFFYFLFFNSEKNVPRLT